MSAGMVCSVCNEKATWVAYYDDRDNDYTCYTHRIIDLSVPLRP